MSKMNNKNKAPFGVRTKRFAPIGYHPGLDPTGSMTADRNKISPGDYDPEPMQCRYKKYQLGGSLWDRQIRTEEFSKNLGYRNAHILDERRYIHSLGGPGSYDVSEEVYKRKSSSVLENVNFGNQPRFYKIEDSFPPPGTYTRDILATSTTIKKQMTPVPTFEWDGFVDRFKRLNKNWQKAPNRYNPIDKKSFEALLARVVSKKGPYNLFTGPRDGSTIKNHFAPGTPSAPDKYYDWQNQTGLNYLLYHPAKKRCGHFLKDKRFRLKPTVRIMMDDLATCYKDPNAPSPAHYNIHLDGITHLPEGKYPFNDSVSIARKGIKWTIFPGPGRYNVKDPRCKYNDKRMSCVFKSTTGRTEYKPPQYTYF